MEKKSCRACNVSFEVTDTDLSFYEKISPTFCGKKYLVPPPTLCPDCRQQRRLCVRNERTFYKRTCDLTGKDIVSLYSPDKPFTIYEQDEWWSDKWNPKDYGVDFDFEKPFFEQFQALMRRVPRISLPNLNCENSHYCCYCGDDKNCYLDIAGESNEDCYFNLFTKYSKNVVDSTFVYNSELVYESINCYRCYHLLFSIFCEDCTDCQFCYECKGCKDCFGCYNLVNRKHCIDNVQHTKEAYLKEIAKRTDHRKNLDDFRETLRSRAIHRSALMLNSQNCTGDNLSNSKNTHYAFNVSSSEDSKFLYDVMENKNCYDVNYSLYEPENTYEVISTLNLKSCISCFFSHYSRNIYYCNMCVHSADLFGCLGLRNQSYCILNKQYTREEYESLVPRIIEHMREHGEWGEFFPVTLSPFGYNETVAGEYFPMTREEALAKGFHWSDYEPIVPTVKKTLPADRLPADIADIPDDILNWAILCEVTGKAFRIIPQELEFYRKHKLPIPRRHPDQRHLDRMALQNPRKLYARTCDTCGTKMETTYAPERREIVYCGTCYDREVYG